MMVTIDPLAAFEKVQPGRLFAATGLIPQFAMEAFAGPSETVREFYDHMVKIYGFGGWELKGGEVDKAGVYLYPEDEPLSPLVLLQYPESSIEVLIYQHAILAIRDEDETIVCRMD